MQRHVLQSGHLGPRIREADIFEPDTVLWVRSASRRTHRWGHFGLEILIQSRQIKVVFVHPADRRQHRGHGGLALTEQHQVHGHLSQRDDAVHGTYCDPGVGTVQSDGSDQPESEPPAVPTHRQSPVLFVEALKDVAIAIEQPGA